jgi:two-component system, OmpR family, KDP operon response regulator KdpE
MRVLVVDDEPQIVRALRINLKARGYEVVVAPDGRGALAAAARNHPDLVILDLGLPDLEGVQVLAGLRGWTDVPVIVLSGRTDSLDKVEALDAGADDYVTKPFGIDELLARMRAVSRRSVPSPEEVQIAVGHYIVDLAAHRVLAAAQSTSDSDTPAADAPDGRPAEVRLTPTEWRMLEVLIRHPGQLVTKRQLLADVWGPGYQREDNYLRLYMTQLRRKLEPDPRHPRHLLTEPGMGYRFQP